MGGAAHSNRVAAFLKEVSTGDPALAMRIEAGSKPAATAPGTALIDYDPPHIWMIALSATPETERVGTWQIQRWTATGAIPVRGVASMATLHDGSSVKISVARSMGDRAQLLDYYPRVIWVTTNSPASSRPSQAGRRSGGLVDSRALMMAGACPAEFSC